MLKNQIFRVDHNLKGRRRPRRKIRQGFGDRLARVLHHLHGLGRAACQDPHPLEQRLYEMIDQDPRRAADFADVALAQVPFWAARVPARVALTMASTVGDPTIKAQFLNNVANYLSSLGRREEALASRALTIS